MPALAIMVISDSTTPRSFSQNASVPATSRNGRPEEKPNTAMVQAAGCANAFQIDGRAAATSAATGSVGIVDRIRRVVGEALLAVDGALAQPLAQRRRDDLVVDPPAHVVLARAAAVGPPGVVLTFRPERAVAVHPAALDQAVEPGALFRQATGVLLVGLPVLDVLLAAHDVPVAAD